MSTGDLGRKREWEHVPTEALLEELAERKKEVQSRFDAFEPRLKKAASITGWLPILFMGFYFLSLLTPFKVSNAVLFGFIAGTGLSLIAARVLENSRANRFYRQENTHGLSISLSR